MSDARTLDNGAPLFKTANLRDAVRSIGRAGCAPPRGGAGPRPRSVGGDC